MSRVDEIKEEIEALSDTEFSSLRQWLADKDWERWEAQIETDSMNGSLDFLSQEALADKQKGKLGNL